VGRPLKLRLTPFEREALEAYGASERVPPERVARTAVLYYLRDQHSERPAWRIPTLSRDEPNSNFALQLELDEDTMSALAEQAAAQGVEPEPLARHALLFFLADVDSGEVARALGRTLRDE
jgi:hypothetical protein